MQTPTYWENRDLDNENTVESCFFLKCVNNVVTMENFNLKSKKCPPICKDMHAFENNPMGIVKNIKFTKQLDNFQKKS